MKKIYLLPLMTLTACAGGVPPNDQGIAVSDENMVKSCKFVGDIMGYSFYDGSMTEYGYSVAHNEAMKKAKTLDATNVVFSQNVGHDNGTTVAGRAYKCNAK